MDTLEVTSKIAGIIIVSEIIIRILYASILQERINYYKPFIVIFVSFVLYFIEYHNEYDYYTILVKSIFEYSSVAMMSYEIVVKRVFNEIIGFNNTNNEKHRHI